MNYRYPLLYKGQNLQDTFTYLTKSLEVLFVLDGVKKSARLVVRDDEIDKITEFCIGNKLPVVQSDFKIVVDFEADKAYSNKGVRVPLSSEVPGERVLYIALDPGDAKAAKDAEQMNDHRKLGQILGYPLCCVDFFEKNFGRESGKKNDYVLAGLANSKRGTYPFFNNIVGRYFDIALLSHFPCSFDCEFSEDTAREYMNTLSNHSPGLAEYISDFLSGVFVFSDDGGVHRLRNAVVDEKEIRFNGVDSTSSTEIGVKLGMCNSIKNSSLFFDDRLVGDIGDCEVIGFE